MSINRIVLSAIVLLAPAVALAKCDASAESNMSSYKKAYSRVSSLPEFKAWPGRQNAVFGAHADQQSIVKGKCYWTVTVYSQEGSDLSLWRTYLVPVGQGPVERIDNALKGD